MGELSQRADGGAQLEPGAQLWPGRLREGGGGRAELRGGAHSWAHVVRILAPASRAGR